MFIPGFIINWLTFPGVLLHELAHYRACQWREIPVGRVQWFSVTGEAFVEHAEPRAYLDTVAISLAPFLVNTVVAVVAYAIAAAVVGLAGGVGWLIGWLGLSFGWHAIPSKGDVDNLWDQTDDMDNWSVWTVVVTPVAVFLYILNALRLFWIDAIYSLLLALVVFGVVGSL